MEFRYRSKTEIATQILKIAVGGNANKSKIMYQSFLSYAQLREYLMVLTENNLLHFDKDTSTFRTTERGRRFLKFTEQVDGLTIGEQLKARRYSE